MNIVLKDTDFIMSCTSAGFKNSFKNKEWKFCISEVTMLDFNPIELYQVKALVSNNEIYKHHFNDKEMEEVYKLYNQFSDNISVSDASAIIMAQKLDNSLIINRNGVFSNICTEHHIKTNDFEWFFDNIK